MRTVFFSFFVLISFRLSAQDSIACNQLPVARPDIAARYDGDITKSFGKLPSALKKATYSGVFKLTVDCKGKVLKVFFREGTFTEDDQEFFADKLFDTQWQPAMDNQANVTSFVFITVNITKGKISAVIQ